MFGPELRLLGVALIVLGFALRMNTLVVVVLAGLTTCLTAGFAVLDTLATLGALFVDNRFMMVPIVLMVPIVGLLERAGLRERVMALLSGAKSASAGRVLFAYQCLRGATSMFGLNIGNHASMVRPLVAPLAEGAAKVADLARRERIRAHAAVAENVGNFFSDDVVVAVGALLLIQGTLRSAGLLVSLSALKAWSVPTALWVVVVGFWRYRRLDRASP